MKIHPVGAELLYVDGQMNRQAEANNCFQQFGKHAYKCMSGSSAPNILSDHTNMTFVNLFLLQPCIVRTQCPTAQGHLTFPKTHTKKKPTTHKWLAMKPLNPFQMIPHTHLKHNFFSSSDTNTINSTSSAISNIFCPFTYVQFFTFP